MFLVRSPILGPVPFFGGSDLGLIPGLGRSCGEGNGNPLQYSSLGDPMDRGAWQAAVHEVAKSCTRLANGSHYSSLSLFFFFFLSSEHIVLLESRAFC